MLMELSDNMLGLVSIIMVSLAITLSKIADDGDSVTVKIIATVVLIATALCVVMLLGVLIIRNGYVW